ncbi:MAG: alpha/beta hydrolase [Candidatus Phaeomarinobacter sp.]
MLKHLPISALLLLVGCWNPPDYDELVRELTPQEVAEAQAYLNEYDVPLPEGWAFERFDMSDGAHVRVGRAVTEGPSAPLLFVPSYTSSQELVSEFMSDWYEMGFEVTAMDLPGQGGSIRREDDVQKTYTGDWSYYGQSVSEVAAHINKTRKSTGPFIVVGESMGGHAVIRAAHDQGLSFIDGLFPLVPAILPHTHNRPPLWFMRWETSRQGSNGNGSEYVMGEGPWYPGERDSEPEDLCGREESRMFKNEALYRTRPDLRVGGSTNEYLHGLFVSADEIAESTTLPELDFPVTLITAGDEIYVQTEIAQNICTEVMTTCELVHIEKATHCVHVDPQPVHEEIRDALLSLIERTELRSIDEPRRPM